MSEPSAALQKAILGALTLGSPSPVSVSVFDSLPQTTQPPYVVIESQIVSERDNFSSRMDDRVIYLSVWSTYPGQKQVLDIMAQIDAALHDRPLTLETGRVVLCRVMRKRTEREPDGKTFMGQVTIRAVTGH